MSFKKRLRTVALAGTLAISAMMPVVPASLASGDTDTVTPTPVTVVVDQFDIDPAGGLEGLTAIVTAGGEGVNLRATADHDGDVLTTVPDGTVVELRVDMVDTAGGQWRLAARMAGSRGFIWRIRMRPRWPRPLRPTARKGR
jgi:hypothetical protein